MLPFELRLMGGNPSVVNGLSMDLSLFFSSFDDIKFILIVPCTPPPYAVGPYDFFFNYP